MCTTTKRLLQHAAGVLADLIYLDEIHTQRAHDHDKVQLCCRVALESLVQQRSYMDQDSSAQDDLVFQQTA